MIFSFKQQGFSLIEMIVALALFSVVITMSVGALLMLVAGNEQLQNEQSVMTNLSFALDSMTREIRTGIHYVCASRANNTGTGNVFNPTQNIDTVFSATTNQDCDTGRFSASHAFQGISFVEAGNSISTAANDRILYFHNAADGRIYRRVGGGPAESIVSSGIFITKAEFFVSGSPPLSAGSSENDQAVVTVFIEAREKDDPTAKPYQIQTTVTQRALDI